MAAEIQNLPPLRFIKYEKIENTRIGIPKHKLDPDNDSSYWCVTEKVHGCNFSFTTDGTTIMCSKRSAKLAEKEAFHGYESVLEKYRSAIYKVHRAVVEYLNVDPQTQVTIFGELFGGSYLHPDVKTSKKVSPIQKGVYYCPWIDFYAFDIFCQHQGYLHYDVCIDFFESSGLFYAKPLLINTLKEVLTFSPEFQSTIPSLLGLPRIENNIAEGVVIKRMKCSRPIIKNKSHKFTETVGGAAFGDALSHARDIMQGKDIAGDNSSAREDFKIAKYVCKNRLESVISKLGNVYVPAQLVGLLAKDAMTDFCKDELELKGLPTTDPSLWNTTVTKDVKARVGKVCAEVSKELVRAYMEEETSISSK